MNRKRFLVAYDVADDKRRNQVFKTLYGYGDHAQYSVFFCELNQQELVELRVKIRRAIHDGEDQVMILDLGAAANPLEAGLECLGKPYVPTTAVLVV
jgi:CRISPR-associated protein Cas2